MDTEIVRLLKAIEIEFTGEASRHQDIGVLFYLIGSPYNARRSVRNCPPTS